MSQPINSGCENSGQFKIFVVGESSGDPNDWSELGRRAFVIATSAEDALAMADFSSLVAELQMLRPGILMYEERIGNQD